MKLSGKLTVLRSHRGDAPMVRIHVRDDEARTNFLVIELTPDALMQAIMGSSQVECTLETANLERVGMLMQTKIIHIDAPKDVVGSLDGQEQQITAALSPHEVDGWIGTRADMTSSRRRCEGQKQAVTFCRWIAAHD